MVEVGDTVVMHVCIDCECWAPDRNLHKGHDVRSYNMKIKK